MIGIVRKMRWRDVNRKQSKKEHKKESKIIRNGEEDLGERERRKIHAHTEKEIERQKEKLNGKYYNK